MPGNGKSVRRSTPLLRAALTVGAASHVATGLWLNGRARRLAVLPAPRRVAPAVDDGDGFSLVTARGVAVDDATFAAGVAHAVEHDLDVLDLVPGDLPSGVLQALVLQIDPATFRDDPLALGRGAGHAALVRTALLARVAAAHPPPGETWRDLDPATFLAVARRLKRYAPTATDLAVAPTLRAVPVDPAWRAAVRREHLGVAAPLAAAPAVGAALAVAAPLARSFGGGVVLAAYLAEPVLVARRSPVHPCDLGVRGVLRRPVRVLAEALRPLPVPAPARVDPAGGDWSGPAGAAHRPDGAGDDGGRGGPGGTARRTCPWCGGRDLAERGAVRAPGPAAVIRFDRCRACGHVFRNPSVADAARSSRPAPDPRRRELAETVEAFAGRAHLARARALRGAAEPKRWLDVGTGHAYFCLAARQEWPETRFDGLDAGPAVAEAERRGWVEVGYQGAFPDLADELRGSYDVVSMLHHLEHAPVPGAELDAAATVLDRGGHLLIEAAGPGSLIAASPGRPGGPGHARTRPPAHHLVPLPNLVAALERRGLRVVSVTRGEAVGAPAHPGASALLAGAALARDRVVPPGLRRRPDLSTAYRVLARRD